MLNCKTCIKYIIKINGIYDILCALSILKIINIPILCNLHLSMIKDNQNKNFETQLFERFFAYWIFTYGVIRLSDNMILISYSYYIESLCFVNEYLNNSVYHDKALFVIVSSFLLGIVSNIL